MRETEWPCLQGRYQFEQAQLPPQAHPPEVDAPDTWLVPTTAKVENIALVFVLSHSGQTWRWSRLAKPPKTSKVWRQLRHENS
jgi:predicted TIM-barrel fold metal-dependent hydrolase